MNKNDKEFLKNELNTPSYMQIQQMIKSGKISKQQAAELIKTRKQKDKLEADLEYEKTRNKEIALGVIDIASAAIPIGGGAKIAGKVASKLVPTLGKKIAQGVTKGAINGAKTGALHGAMTGIVDEDKNPVTQTIKEGAMGAVTGSVTSYALGKGFQKTAGDKLKLDKPAKNGASIKEIKEYRKTAKKYYKDYIQETSIKLNNYGKINFGKENAGKTSPHNLDIYPDLKKQLKNAKYTKTTNYKNEKDRTYDHFEGIYKNKTLDYQIEVFNNNKKYFKTIKEVGPSPKAGSNPAADKPYSNNIIANNDKGFNPIDAINNETLQKAVENTLIKTAAIKRAKLQEKAWTTESVLKGKAMSFDRKHYAKKPQMMGIG